MSKRRCRHFDPREAGAAISLRADRGVARTGSAVDSWTSSDSTPVVATSSGSARPTFAASSSSFGGFPALTFDGTDDYLDATATAAGIFNSKSTGRIFAACNDTNQSGGDAGHVVALFTNNTGLFRASVMSRVLSTAGYHSAGRRIDSDTTTISGNAGGSGQVAIAESAADWSSGTHNSVFNGLSGSAASYPSGSGSTSATNSFQVLIGASGNPPTANRFPGQIAQITVFNTAIDAALAARVRHCAARLVHTACS